MREQLMRLVQLRSGERRAVAVVEEPSLRLVRGFVSVYALAMAAVERGELLPPVVEVNLGDEVLDYDAVYEGTGAWRLMAAIDHPAEPARCVVSGTGLTHLGSAADR
ncbi:MAG: GguC protein, partial [Acidobacteriaceae bacterium]